MSKVLEAAQSLGNSLFGENAFDTMAFECVQTDGVFAERGTILFSEIDGESLACEAVNETARRLAAAYNFEERASNLNISDARDSDYVSIEREGSEPMYVVFELGGGFSKTLSERTIKAPDAKPTKEDRNRFWPDEVVHDFAEQVRKRRPVGYMGHADLWSFSQIPENIPVQWETAVKARRKSDNQAVTLVRGYVYDAGMNRAYLKTGAINSASVFTVGTHEMDTTDEKHPFVRVKSAALISFDFVRKHTHGIPGTRLVASINTQTEASAMEFTAEQLAFIAGLKAEDIRKYNPALHAELAKSDNAGDLVEMSRTIRELTESNVALSRRASVAEQISQKLSTDADHAVEKVDTLLTTSRAIVESAINAVVSNVKGEGLRKRIAADLMAANVTDLTTLNAKFTELMASYRDLATQMAEEAGTLSATGLFVVPEHVSGESLAVNAEDM